VWIEKTPSHALTLTLHKGVCCSSNEQVTIRTLPGGLMASTVHTGYRLSIGQAFTALHRWRESNGYRLAGPARTIDLQRAEHMDPDQYAVEIQFAITK
jgi:effector-binding domain-containing protein